MVGHKSKALQLASYRSGNQVQNDVNVIWRVFVCDVTAVEDYWIRKKGPNFVLEAV